MCLLLRIILLDLLKLLLIQRSILHNEIDFTTEHTIEYTTNYTLEITLKITLKDTTVHNVTHT